MTKCSSTQTALRKKLPILAYLRGWRQYAVGQMSLVCLIMIGQTTFFEYSARPENTEFVLTYVSYIMELRYSPVCKSSLSIPMAAQVPTTKVPKNAGFCCSSNGMANCLKQNLTSTCWSQLLLMVIYRCIWCTLQVGDHEIQNDTAAWMQISGR